MAAKDLIARGIGFNPGSVKFVPTLGLTPTGPVATATYAHIYRRRQRWYRTRIIVFALLLF